MQALAALVVVEEELGAEGVVCWADKLCGSYRIG